MTALPETIRTTAELDEVLSRPSDALVELFESIDGDVMILGAGGKVGPSLARMARRAVDASGQDRRVIAVARSPLESLATEGVETIACDLMDPQAVSALPRARNIIYLVGRKFGSTGQEHLTWAVNVVIPVHVARHCADARVVAFSTGCVYPVMHVDTGGATEETPPAPVGEYAMSCLGRERMFDYFSRAEGLEVVHFRLNYAVELRYGVLFDVASRVFAGEPVDVTTGYANVLWQGDVCDQALRCLPMASSPPEILNVTGTETIAIRDVAKQFGELLGRSPIFEGEENGMGYLSNASKAAATFGPPRVPVETVLRWVAEWIRAGGESLEKPTHFETQDGKY